MAEKIKILVELEPEKKAEEEARRRRKWIGGDDDRDPPKTTLTIRFWDGSTILDEASDLGFKLHDMYVADETVHYDQTHTDTWGVKDGSGMQTSVRCIQNRIKVDPEKLAAHWGSDDFTALVDGKMPLKMVLEEDVKANNNIFPVTVQTPNIECTLVDNSKATIDVADFYAVMDRMTNADFSLKEEEDGLLAYQWVGGNDCAHLRVREKSSGLVYLVIDGYFNHCEMKEGMSGAGTLWYSVYDPEGTLGDGPWLVLHGDTGGFNSPFGWIKDTDPGLPASGNVMPPGHSVMRWRDHDKIDTIKYTLEGIFWNQFDTSDQVNYKITKEPSYTADEHTEAVVSPKGGQTKIDVFLIPRYWWIYARFGGRDQICYGITCMPPRDFEMPAKREDMVWEYGHIYNYMPCWQDIMLDSEEDAAFEDWETLNIDAWRATSGGRNDMGTLREDHTITIAGAYGPYEIRERAWDYVPMLLDGDNGVASHRLEIGDTRELNAFWMLHTLNQGNLYYLVGDYQRTDHEGGGITYSKPEILDYNDYITSGAYKIFQAECEFGVEDMTRSNYPYWPWFVPWGAWRNWPGLGQRKIGSCYAETSGLVPRIARTLGFWGSAPDGKVPTMLGQGTLGIGKGGCTTAVPNLGSYPLQTKYGDCPWFDRQQIELTDGRAIKIYDESLFEADEVAKVDSFLDFFLSHPVCSRSGETPDAYLLGPCAAAEGDLLAVIKDSDGELYYVWRRTPEDEFRYQGPGVQPLTGDIDPSLATDLPIWTTKWGELYNIWQVSGHNSFIGCQDLANHWPAGSRSYYGRFEFDLVGGSLCPRIQYWGSHIVAGEIFSQQIDLERKVRVALYRCSDIPQQWDYMPDSAHFSG